MNDCFLNLFFSFQLLLPLKEGADFVGSKQTIDTPIRDKIAISCMLRQIHESSSHAIRHGLYIKNRKRLFCP